MNKKTRFSIAQIEAASTHIDPVFLRTPQFIQPSLGEIFDCNVLLKVETLNPIRSFKGRGAELLVAQAADQNPLMCASAGNFGQAMAYSCRKRQIQLTVYASVTANSFKVDRMRKLGAMVVLHGEDFDRAKIEARRIAQESGVRFVEDSLDVETVIGAGTIGLELVSFNEPIDVILIALGNGALMNGTGSIFKARSASTRVIAVQAAGAPAMVESWRSGSIIYHEEARTIADGIAVRIPVEEALTDMQDIVDDAILVSEQSILKAIKIIHQHAGIVVEPSGAVGIAAMLEQPARFKGKTVATILCGGNMTAEQYQSWL